ncbi:MAG: nitrous oxide reductase family maturation protein NosD [Bacteroidetes bacterium]|nr:MAG: nitrous oxide reductase family maturation protein NosD [Bacteroidota bacterium]REK33260.1 MAG: nitrous oxide reductase family maturation protein NosD [Bacteroidota bacterium]REK47097.1 MAG: nitrous oxide reductase family maturation protein NosD [Bacteroidota bacterium]
MLNPAYIIILFALLISFSSNAVKIHVGGSDGLASIREAVMKAKAGDTVLVRAGVYMEGSIVLNKGIVLLAEKGVEIDAQGKEPLIVIRADKSVVKGFTLKNSGYSDIAEIAGIRLENVKACRVEDNYLYNNFFGIYLSNSSYCILRNNVIHGFARTETSSGNGIHLWKSDHNTVLGNKIKGHRDGIYFEFVKNSSIINNISEDNLRYGLHFMFSDNDVYRYNIFRRNGSGVAVMYTRDVEMSFNRFEHNWGSASYGLLLKDISKSQIRNNMFLRNTTGLYMEGSHSTIIEQNDFRENGWALRILGDCYNDTITSNNFIGNSFDVATNAVRNMNYFYSNYWDKYTGYDLNKDGTGDISYYPVSLYSKITEENPYALMMLHSFFIDLLNQTEKLLPSITPDQFLDALPKMKKLMHDTY